MKESKFGVRITGKNRSKGAFSSLKRSLASVRKQVFSLKGAFAGLAAVGGFGSAIRHATKALDEFDLLAKKARTRGLNTDFYQGLQVGATEAGVNLSMLDSSLLAFVKRVGEAQGGLGPLVSGLKKTNIALLENIRNAGSQEQALKLLSDAIAKADSASEKAALANAAFGRSGIEMVRVLSQGRQGLDETLQKARALGLVIDKELLASAEKTNNEFGLANRIIGVQFKSAMVKLAPAITDVTSALASGLREVSGMVGAVKELAGAWGLVDKALNVPMVKLYLDYNKFALGKIKSLSSQLKRESRKQKSDFGTKVNSSAKSDRGLIGVPIPRVKPPTPPGFGIPKTPRRRDSAIDAAKRQAERIKEVTDALKFETAQLGRTAEQQRLYNELKSAGVTLNSESGQRIAGLVSQLSVEEKRIKALADEKQRLTELTGYLGDVSTDALSSIVLEGEKASDVIKGLARSLANAALQGALLGKGPLGGLFGKGGGLLGNLFGGDRGGPKNIIPGGGGGLFGSFFKSLPGFATGGSFEVGGRGGIDNNLVAFRASKGEQVSITPPGGRGRAAAGPSINISTNIDARGSQLSEAQLQAVLDQRDENIKRQIAPLVSDAVMRGQMA